MMRPTEAVTIAATTAADQWSGARALMSTGSKAGTSTLATIPFGVCADVSPKKNVVLPGPEVSAAQTG